MQRVSIVGAPGSGKSTSGRRLAASLGVPFVELDSIYHQAGWQELPRDEFRARVGATLAGDAWVVDGNYSAVRDLVWQRADTVVWLDLHRALVMRRVTVRTLRRVLTRQRLWNGNREPLANLYRRDPTQNIIRWASLKHRDYAVRYAAAIRDPALAHLLFLRLRTAAEVEALIAPG